METILDLAPAVLLFSFLIVIIIAWLLGLFGIFCLLLTVKNNVVEKGKRYFLYLALIFLAVIVSIIFLFLILLILTLSY
jgi:predicted membrane channel-forming protein YqfA (hemolysin III family)